MSTQPRSYKTIDQNTIKSFIGMKTWKNEVVKLSSTFSQQLIKILIIDHRTTQSL